MRALNVCRSIRVNELGPELGLMLDAILQEG